MSIIVFRHCLIEFIGGTLNNLYQQTQIATKYDEERKCYIKTYPVFKKEYSVKIKDIECKLILQNMPSENSPSIMNLIVRYEFPKEMPIKIIKLGSAESGYNKRL